MTDAWTVAVLWRGDDDARRAGIASNERLRPIFTALGELGVEARPVVHQDDVAACVRDQLLAVDGVLVWVDPIGRDEDRHHLDAILREVSAAGVWVSAHPDVVTVMGTKEVLFRTRQLGWGTDVHRYATLDELRAGLPTRMATGPRVLKRQYGNRGIGVWKVEATTRNSTEPIVRVHGAEVRDTNEEEVTLADLIARCAPLLDGAGCVVDQPFLPRIAEGLIRCYVVSDRVVGFARQSAASLLVEPGAAARVMGLPSPKEMHPADAAEFGRLRTLMEQDWVPGMVNELGLSMEDLPVLWDADFILGPTTAAGEDSYLLCEINCSSVTPFPPDVPTRLARAVLERLSARRAPQPTP